MNIAQALTWNGELTCIRHDPETDAWLIIAIDSTRRGPAAGGTRAMTYPSVADAIADATRLAQAMTLKMAAADLPMGGGKSVLALPRPRHQLDDATWQRILELHAMNLQRLGGSYSTGPDVGTNSADMDVLGTNTDHVFGRSEGAGGAGSSAEMTARGVFAAIQVSAVEAGMSSLRDRRVLVQGLGAVGAGVAELAQEQGARLLVSDVVDSRVEVFRRRGAAVVSPTDVTQTDCDVLVPCATGGLIDASVARALPAAVVAGAANNILHDSSTAEILRERGIVYAPDFVANAGGAVHLIGREVLGWSAEQVSARTQQIGDTLRAIFDDARTRGVTTDSAASDLARGRLGEATGS